MEGYGTGVVVGSVDQSWSSVTTTAAEEYADKDEKKTGACANSNASDESSARPLGFNSVISTTKYPGTLPLRRRRSRGTTTRTTVRTAATVQVSSQ